MPHEHIRFVEEIGMFGFSRGCDTCKWATPWCRQNCYAKKFYAMGWAKREWDNVDDQWWRTTDPRDFAKLLRHLTPLGPPDRFRFSIKGEIWTAPEDVTKVSVIAAYTPKTHFWIPTRAWHDRGMLQRIMKLANTRSNAHVLCSVDPSDTENDLNMLRLCGMSIVATGGMWNNRDQQMLTEQGVEPSPVCHMHRCEKTWEQRGGYCATCEDGCFKEGRVEVHLKKHR